MRVVTWNINSVRFRLHLLDKFISEYAPDVLCLQETKVVNSAFPSSFFEERGYVHQHFDGMKAYNGVAILSKIPFAAVGQKKWQGRDDKRHVFVTLADGVEIHNLYVPAGGDIPDSDVNEKFAHKLGFLDEMAVWAEEEKIYKKNALLVGDLNVAPEENDVWSHKQLLDVVSHTPIEVEKFRAAQKAGQWVDVSRTFVPLSEKLYSWWSYRSAHWEESDRGRRLDHVWATPSLFPRLRKPIILKEARGWGPSPSDHAPVMVDLG